MPLNAHSISFLETGKLYLSWLALVTLAYMYNAVACTIRPAFVSAVVIDKDTPMKNSCAPITETPLLNYTFTFNYENVTNFYLNYTRNPNLTMLDNTTNVTTEENAVRTMFFGSAYNETMEMTTATITNRYESTLGGTTIAYNETMAAESYNTTEADCETAYHQYIKIGMIFSLKC